MYTRQAIYHKTLSPVLFIIIIFNYMYKCVSTCDQKRASDPVDFELQAVELANMGAGRSSHKSSNNCWAISLAPKERPCISFWNHSFSRTLVLLFDPIPSNLCLLLLHPCPSETLRPLSLYPICFLRVWWMACFLVIWVLFTQLFILAYMFSSSCVIAMGRPGQVCSLDAFIPHLGTT